MLLFVSKTFLNCPRGVKGKSVAREVRSRALCPRELKLRIGLGCECL